MPHSAGRAGHNEHDPCQTFCLLLSLAGHVILLSSGILPDHSLGIEL